MSSAFEIRLDVNEFVFPRPEARGTADLSELTMAGAYCAAPGDPPRSRGCTAGAQFDGSAAFGANQEFQFAWSIVCDSSTLQVTLTVDVNEIGGWFGYG